ncbi:DNA polymerase domain-containing protein [Clostridium peptidivorans]|uniref:DNA polymerase domain-containing protein n=1 Tax=Clostridium peptidivorans TaxID=100174 RepID=UPI000BE2D9D6|nr:DNA polymerase domain-containing protein [Clostridium peptidivorans]
MLFYDFEVFRYNWLVVIMDTDTKKYNVCIDNPNGLKKFYEAHKDDIWVGYNSRSYDQYILKAILLDLDPWELNNHIIQAQQPAWMFSRDFNKFQLYNFDIMTDVTKGLKQLEGYMGNNIKESDVAFNIDRPLNSDEIVETVKYCKSDVENTMEVFMQRIEEFNSQMSLIKAFNLNIKYISMTKPQLSAIILGARKKRHQDEFEITIPDNLKVDKYSYVVDWYKNRLNRDYKSSLKCDVAGVPHIFAWGGLHGAKEKYYGEGIFLNCDVASLYPSLMIEYNYVSRNVSDRNKFREIRDTRLKLKKAKNPMQLPYKLVLNSTYGAMKDKNNNLYDPLMANNVCVAGQLFLLDLIEKLENHCELIQSNTDGLFLKVRREKDIDKIKAIAAEWEQRTRLQLEWETFSKIYQKDVNNYIVVHEDNSYKSKGAYVKKLEQLDYDLPIVNIALREYFVNGTSVETTVNNCNKLIEFQKVVKITSKYKGITYNSEPIPEKCIRVFASRSLSDGPVMKINSKDKPEKIANTPGRCFIENGDMKEKRISRKLDKQWYIDVAKKRLEDFGITGQLKWEV